jgi:hypothetical protein
MHSVHFKCGRDDGINLNGVSFDKGKGVWRSASWDISVADAEALIGGWIYLHPTKAARAEFGGRILSFERVKIDKPHEHRIAFVFRGAA